MDSLIGVDEIYHRSGAEVLDLYPFPHFTWTPVYEEPVANSLLDWLRTSSQWVGTEKEHWRASAFAVSPKDIPATVKPVFSGASLRSLRMRLEQAYEQRFSNAVSIQAFRHGPGDQTAIHKDYTPGKIRFTHRLITYFHDSTFDPEQGKLRLFEEGDPEPRLVREYSPRHNSGASLAFGPASLHQVAGVTTGFRYSLVWSFTAGQD